jgi:RsiW-degrading membrane proteinase PrsW (M82 family)
VLLFAALTLLALLGGNVVALYAVLLVGALVAPVVFVQYLAEANILHERPVELIATALLGAAFGLPAAILLQRAAGLAPGGWPAALSIALIEEPAKVLGVAWLLGRPALRFRMDGVIFGAAAGMGFAAIETGLYAVARIDTVSGFLGLLWARALLAPFTHGTWTAIVCATLWRARALGLSARAGWTRIAAALAAAVLLHAAWDWQVLPPPGNVIWLLLVGAISLWGLQALLRRAAAEEARSVAALAPEVAFAAPDAPRLACVGCAQRAPSGARYCPRCGLALRAA